VPHTSTRGALVFAPSPLVVLDANHLAAYDGFVGAGPAISADFAMGEKWYQSGLKFTCTQCGNCCSGDPGYVWATKDEIKGIAKFLGNGNQWLDKAHLRRVGTRYSLTEKANGDCVFLKREAGKALCTIYPVRPLQCRTWPFWTENLRSEAVWQSIHERVCPGMNHGAHHDFVQIETVRKQRTW
jgi:Fe-S-cluster containining protein